MEKILIRTNEDKDVGLEVTGRVESFLKMHGREVIIEKINSSQYTEREPGHILDEKIDCVIVLGGDGTMLRAARDFVNDDVALLGINLGTVGYLTDVGVDDIDAALKKLIAGEYEIEYRMMLEGSPCEEGKPTGHAFALNDIVVSKDTPYQAISFAVYINGQFLTSYVADGIIVSTPTGSTGYNLSAGGPIVEPPANLMVMTPISPHTINSRSIILSSEDEVTITIVEGKDGKKQSAVAMADSGNRFKLQSGDSFTLHKSEKCAKFIKLSRESFLKVLHDKLQ